ncbi:GTP pyrophosphokinase family protein [Bacillus hwajinpoensis]|jgi:putative GTP pyrophosphokinase|uniref:GTP pyrophosphokinase family protein n=1 Tax=Guptibacillus hwajinpoensis TaxID=208199 RepID=A0A845EQ72_9BACL|nr:MULTISPECIES: GTP pyrophosphokinase family protein [Bacillaceae]MYL61882.1 GTP pyrophosphokinase family protein [Pseudalkalibacillus hwajinpoensis]QHA93325.1 GTP pyrophosphokinase family protein [Bacillus sp. N1-1]
MKKEFQERIEEWKNFLFIYKFALDEINTKLTILNDEFQFVHQHNPIEHVKSRIKSPESIMAKLERKGLEVTTENVKQHINDIAGVRVTCSFTNDIYRIYDMIESQDDIRLIDVKDYVKNPKPNGYKSLHLIVEIPVFLSKGPELVRVEIQLRTIAMDFWASLEHKIYYKFEGEIPDKLSNELKEAAEIVHYLDAKMMRIKDEVNEFKEHEIEEKKLLARGLI